LFEKVVIKPVQENLPDTTDLIAGPLELRCPRRPSKLHVTAYQQHPDFTDVWFIYDFDMHLAGPIQRRVAKTTDLVFESILEDREQPK
jgi:hypothetical protein